MLAGWPVRPNRSSKSRCRRSNSLNRLPGKLSIDSYIASLLSVQWLTAPWRRPRSELRSRWTISRELPCTSKAPAIAAPYASACKRIRRCRSCTATARSAARPPAAAATCTAASGRRNRWRSGTSATGCGRAAERPLPGMSLAGRVSRTQPGELHVAWYLASHRPGAAARRRAACVAVQQRLGLLAQRRPRHRGAGAAGVVVDGPLIAAACVQARHRLRSHPGGGIACGASLEPFLVEARAPEAQRAQLAGLGDLEAGRVGRVVVVGGVEQRIAGHDVGEHRQVGAGAPA